MPINHVDDRLAFYNVINDFIIDYVRRKENDNNESRCLTVLVIFYMTMILIYI